MRVFVIGGSGFLGTHVLDQLAGRGHQAIALARSDTAAATVRGHGADAATGDLDDPASVAAALGASGADTLIGVASLQFGHAPSTIIAAQEAGVDRMVVTSSTSVFTAVDPALKRALLAGEDAVRSSDMAWTILRPTMIYGTPDDRNLWRLLGLLGRTPVVPTPGAGHLHQPVHVADLAHAVVSAAERPEAAGVTYAIGGPEAITLRTLIEQAGSARGRRTRVLPLPTGAVRRLLAMIAKVRTLPISADQVARLGGDKVHDITPARRDLGFDPRPFHEGIAQEAAFLS